MKRRILLIAFGLSSCLLPRVDFDQGLGSAGTSAGGSGGAAPTGGTGAGGTANPGGGKTGSGGAPSAQGGKSGAGSGGSVQTGGATSSAGSTGTAGRGSGGNGGGGASGNGGSSGSGAGGCAALAVSQSDAKCCVASAPTTNVLTSLAIDDLEDDDNAILPIGERQGYWFAYADSKTTQMPVVASPAAGGHACTLLPAPPACAGKVGGTAYSAATGGSLAVSTQTSFSYAGLGFDFNNRLGKSCIYGASAYRGISFWAKGNMALRAMIKIPGTTSTSTPYSVGTCTLNCEDHYGITVPVLDPATWKQFTITFSDRVNFTQAGWGTPVSFDPTALLAMQFQVSGSITATTTTPYSFSIDDVAFIQ